MSMRFSRLKSAGLSATLITGLLGGCMTAPDHTIPGPVAGDPSATLVLRWDPQRNDSVFQAVMLSPAAYRDENGGTYTAMGIQPHPLLLEDQSVVKTSAEMTIHAGSETHLIVEAIMGASVSCWNGVSFVPEPGQTYLVAQTVAAASCSTSITNETAPERQPRLTHWRRYGSSR